MGSGAHIKARRADQRNNIPSRGARLEGLCSLDHTDTANVGYALTRGKEGRNENDEGRGGSARVHRASSTARG